MIIAGNSHVSIFRGRIRSELSNKQVEVKWVGAIKISHFLNNYSSAQAIRSLFSGRSDWKLLSIGMHDVFLLCHAFVSNQYEEVLKNMIMSFQTVFSELNSNGKFGWLISPQQLDGSGTYGISENRVYRFSEEFNKKMSKWCEENSIVVINPLNEIIDENNHPKNKFLQKDGIHLNDAAVELYVKKINQKTDEAVFFVSRVQSLENALQADTEPESLSLLIADELGLPWDQTKLSHGTRNEFETDLIHYIIDQFSAGGDNIVLDRNADYTNRIKLSSTDMVNIYTHASELLGGEINFDVDIKELNTVEKLSSFIYKNKTLTKNDFFETLTPDTIDIVRKSETLLADLRIGRMPDDMYSHFKEIIHLQTGGENFGYGIIFFWFAIAEAERFNYGLALNLLANSEDITLSFPFISSRIEYYRDNWKIKLVEQQNKIKETSVDKTDDSLKVYECADLWWPEEKFVRDEDDLLHELASREKAAIDKIKILYASGIYDLKRIKLYFDIFKQLKKMYLFIPVPVVYKQLKELCSNDTRIKIFPYALSDADGYDLLVTNHINYRLNIYMGEQRHLISGKTISVECRNLENFISQNDLLLPDLLIYNILGMEERFFSSFSSAFMSKIQINYFSTNKQLYYQEKKIHDFQSKVFYKKFIFLGSAPISNKAKKVRQTLFLNNKLAKSIVAMTHAQLKILNTDILEDCLNEVPNIINPAINTQISNIREAIYQHGNNLMNDDLFHDAIYAFNKAIEINPGHSMTFYKLGMLYWKREKANEAWKYLKTAFSLDPANKIISFSFAEFCISIGKQKQAGEIYAIFLRINPQDVDAQKHLDKIVSTEKAGNGERGSVVGSQRKEAGDQISEVRSQKTARQKETGTASPEKLYQTAQKLISSEKEKEAIGAVKVFLSIYPDYALAHNDLGVLYYNDGNKKEALNHYQQAVRLEPENATFQKNVADFYFVEAGRVEEALQIYIKLLEANPTDIETLLILGQISESLKKVDDAMVFYNKVLEIDPGNAYAIEKFCGQV